MPPYQNLASFFRELARSQPWLFFILTISSLTWSLDQTLWPVIIGNFVNELNAVPEGAPRHIWQTLSSPITWGLVLWIGCEVGFRIQGFTMALLEPRLHVSIRSKMFHYLHGHSYGFYSSEMAGSISNRIGDMVVGVTWIIQPLFTVFLPSAAAIAIATVIFWTIAPLMAILMLLWVALHMAISFFFLRGCEARADRHAEQRSLLMGYIVDSIINQLLVKLYGRLPSEERRLARYQAVEQRLHQESLFYMEYMKIALGFSGLVGGGSLIAYMLWGWREGFLDTGQTVLILNTTWNIFMMTWLTALHLPSFFRTVGLCQQAIKPLQRPHEVQEKADAQPLLVTKGSIVFDNVHFSYGDKRIFEGRDVAIAAGEKVGLVGFTGAGKTTFVHLILRLYDVQQGRILIDGQDISAVTLASLRRQISFIPQEPVLFHRSLWDNIAYAVEGASDEQVLAASHKAHCHEFISKLKDGYDTPVGERGLKLSGGQRQRIAIARAFLKNAPILILDEATAALDSLTEHYVQESLEEMMQGKTTIIIAHRLSTLRRMDRLLVFDKGMVVEEGSHEQLLAHGGHYATLWNMQVGGFLIGD